MCSVKKLILRLVSIMIMFCIHVNAVFANPMNPVFSDTFEDRSMMKNIVDGTIKSILDSSEEFVRTDYYSVFSGKSKECDKFCTKYILGKNVSRYLKEELLKKAKNPSLLLGLTNEGRSFWKHGDISTFGFRLRGFFTGEYSKLNLESATHKSAYSVINDVADKLTNDVLFSNDSVWTVKILCDFDGSPIKIFEVWSQSVLAGEYCAYALRFYAQDTLESQIGNFRGFIEHVNKGKFDSQKKADGEVTMLKLMEEEKQRHKMFLARKMEQDAIEKKVVEEQMDKCISDFEKESSALEINARCYLDELSAIEKILNSSDERQQLLKAQERLGEIYQKINNVRDSSMVRFNESWMSQKKKIDEYCEALKNKIDASKCRVLHIQSELTQLEKNLNLAGQKYEREKSKIIVSGKCFNASKLEMAIFDTCFSDVFKLICSGKNVVEKLKAKIQDMESESYEIKLNFDLVSEKINLRLEEIKRKKEEEELAVRYKLQVMQKEEEAKRQFIEEVQRKKLERQQMLDLEKEKEELCRKTRELKKQDLDQKKAKKERKEANKLIDDMLKNWRALLDELYNEWSEARTKKSQALFEIGCSYKQAGNFDAAVKRFIKAANMDHEHSQYCLGLCYEEGLGVSEDAILAEYWFERAANLGLSKAKCKLAQYAENGVTKKEDIPRAIKLYSEAVKLDNIEAMYFLGKLYARCKTIRGNKLAFDLFKKASDRGHSDAKIQLALCYETACGTCLDRQKAIEIYQIMVSEGNAFAIYRLGYYYERLLKGDCTKKAIELYEIASNLGCSEAKIQLGDCYLKGIGVPRNFRRAFDLFSQALHDGNKGALVKLALCHLRGHGVGKNPKKAELLCKQRLDGLSYFILASIYAQEENRAWIEISRLYKIAKTLFRQQFNEGDLEAGVYLADMRFSEGSRDGDLREAISLFVFLEKSGVVLAKNMLGLCYLNGSGVEQSAELAFQKYKESAEAGCYEAYVYLAQLYRNGVGVEKNLEEADRCYKIAQEYNVLDGTLDIVRRHIE